MAGETTLKNHAFLDRWRDKLYAVPVKGVVGSGVVVPREVSMLLIKAPSFFFLKQPIQQNTSALF